MVALPGDPALAALVTTLGGGETTRLIGGVVRDSILGAPVSDIDMATRLTPDAVLARLADAGIKAVPTGLAHGTITAVLATGPVEITTLRRDVATDGRHAVVAFTDDWQEDAARRDFTINALSANPQTGEVYDYFDGQADLVAARVRFIGDPLQRIAEDHLRILRFFRFHARFGRGDPQATDLAACAARANDLMALSRERVAAELLKLLDAPDPVPTVRIMLANGIFAPILPEITDVTALARLALRETDFAIAPSPIRRLSALIGPNPVLAATIAARLKLSKAQTKRLVLACDPNRRNAPPRALAYRIGIEGARDRLLLAEGDATDFGQLDALVLPALPIGGGALIERGLPPGPGVARTLRTIEDVWVAEDFPLGDRFDAIVADAISRATP